MKRSPSIHETPPLLGARNGVCDEDQSGASIHETPIILGCKMIGVVGRSDGRRAVCCSPDGPCRLEQYNRKRLAITGQAPTRHRLERHGYCEGRI